MSQKNQYGFTLIELLMVVAIMGMMGALSIGAYRSMKQGLEERGVVQNASQFIRLAYQRAQIEGQAVNIYFWNETLKAENEDEEAVVMGRAVAVRRNGRFTRVDSDHLVDEFGDLRAFRRLDDEGEFDENDSSYKNSAGMYLYQINGNESSMKRSIVGMMTGCVSEDNIRMVSDPFWKSGENDSSSGNNQNSGGRKIYAYGYYLKDKNGVTWQVGDAYGTQFAEFDLPKGYIFGSNYSKSLSTSVAGERVVNFNVDKGGSFTIEINALRPDESGAIVAKSLGNTDSPTSKENKE